MSTLQFGPGERWALVAAVAYTVVNVTLRAAAPAIDPVLGSLLRQVPMAIVAWSLVLRAGAPEFRPGHPEFLGWRLVAYLLGAGSVSFVLGNVLYFLALTTGGLGITVSAMQAGSVLGGIWIGLVFLGDPPSRAQLAGVALVVAGLVGVGVAQTGGAVADGWWVGLLLALGAGTTYAMSNSLTRAVQRRRPLLFVTLAGSSLGGMVPLALVVGGRIAAQPESITVTAPSVAAVLAAGCANAVALASLAMAVRTATVATVTTISSGSIVLSFAGSVLLFHETGSPPMVVGVVLVTAGIVVAQLRRASAPAATAAPTPVGEGP